MKAAKKILCVLLALVMTWSILILSDSRVSAEGEMKTYTLVTSQTDSLKKGTEVILTSNLTGGKQYFGTSNDGKSNISATKRSITKMIPSLTDDTLPGGVIKYTADDSGNIEVFGKLWHVSADAQGNTTIINGRDRILFDATNGRFRKCASNTTISEKLQLPRIYICEPPAEKYAARIGDISYPTFDAAWAAASACQTPVTIQLFANADVTAGNLDLKDNITLDLNGCRLSAAGTVRGKADMSVVDSGNGSGVLAVQQESLKLNGANKSHAAWNPAETGYQFFEKNTGAVAVVNGAVYTDLAEAMNASQNMEGALVTLLNEARIAKECSILDHGTVLDLNGHNVGFDGYAVVMDGSSITDTNSYCKGTLTTGSAGLVLPETNKSLPIATAGNMYIFAKVNSIKNEVSGTNNMLFSSMANLGAYVNNLFRAEKLPECLNSIHFEVCVRYTTRDGFRAVQNFVLTNDFVSQAYKNGKSIDMTIMDAKNFTAGGGISSQLVLVSDDSGVKVPCGDAQTFTPGI